MQLRLRSDKIDMLYLYCVRNKKGPKIFSTGIDGKGDVFTVPYKDIEAVVSKLSSREFSLPKINERAENDLTWIKEKAQRHEAVIEEAMGLGKNQTMSIRAVIPMKFGTIFKDKKNLIESLRKHCEQFKNGLKKLRGKQEWNLKVYLIDSVAMEEYVRLKSEQIKAKEKEIASMNEGAAYFGEKEIEGIISREKERTLEEFRENIFQALQKQSKRGARGKLLGKELTGRQEPMIFKGTFLVEENSIGDFKKEIKKLAKNFPAGKFEYSGPWPSYNFI